MLKFELIIIYEEDYILKKIIWAIISLVIILLLNWGTATLFNNDFIDWSFLTGLAVTIIVAFFNSSGGFMSDLADSRLQSTNNDEYWAATEVWSKIDRQKRQFRPSISFYIALLYTIIAGILSLIYYKGFFDI